MLSFGSLSRNRFIGLGTSILTLSATTVLAQSTTPTTNIAGISWWQVITIVSSVIGGTTIFCYTLYRIIREQNKTLKGEIYQRMDERIKALRELHEQRFNQIEMRFDKVDQRLEKIDSCVREIDKKLEVLILVDK